MIQLQTDGLRTVLTFFHEFHFLLTMLHEDLAQDRPIGDLAFTTKGLYELVEENREDGQPTLPVVIGEIRANLLNLNHEEIAKYNSYALKYIADYDKQFFATIVLFKNTLPQNLTEYRAKDLEKKLLDLIYQSKEIAYKSQAEECLHYAACYFIICWEELKNAVSHEINVGLSTDSGIRAKQEETSQGLADSLTLKQKILLLTKLGFFELPLLQSLPLTKVADIAAPLLGRHHKNAYDAIRERLSLHMNKKDMDVIDQILKQITPGK